MSLTPRSAHVTGRLPTTLLLLQRNGCPRSRATPLPTFQGALHCLPALCQGSRRCSYPTTAVLTAAFQHLLF